MLDLQSEQLMSTVEEMVIELLEDDLPRGQDQFSRDLLRGNEQLVRRYVTKYVCKAASQSRAHL